MPLLRWIFGNAWERLVNEHVLLEHRVRQLENERLERETQQATMIADLTGLVRRLNMREVRALKSNGDAEHTGIADLIQQRRRI